MGIVLKLNNHDIYCKMEKSVIDLVPGEKAVIIGIEDSELMPKLLEMGCVPGEELELTKIAPLGCPLAIYISGYELSLRKTEAQQIRIKPIS